MVNCNVTGNLVTIEASGTLTVDDYKEVLPVIAHPQIIKTRYPISRSLFTFSLSLSQFLSILFLQYSVRVWGILKK